MSLTLEGEMQCVCEKCQARQSTAIITSASRLSSRSSMYSHLGGLLVLFLLMSTVVASPLARRHPDGMLRSRRTGGDDVSSLAAEGVQPWLDHCKGGEQRRICEECQLVTGDERTYPYCCTNMHDVYQYCQTFLSTYLSAAGGSGSRLATSSTHVEDNNADAR